MPHFKIVLAYDGTDFVGWQRQAAGTSIQGLVEDALGAIDGSAVTVTGAGRTDAGVHALGQVASFALRREIDGDVLVRALNARLPATIRVWSAQLVPPSFNARFDAVSKRYCYRICNGPIISPFERNYALHVRRTLDVEAMIVAAAHLEGFHDFAAFQAAGSDVVETQRTMALSRVVAEAAADATDQFCTRDELDGARVSRVLPPPLKLLRATEASGEGGRDARLITYEITGDGFLRHMVRSIVGTLVEIGHGRRTPESMREVLARRDRAAAGPTAPARGLFLVGVDYGALAAEP